MMTALVIALAVFGGNEPVWKPVDGPLLTTWGAEVTPRNVWPQYPRPTLQRATWQNLNGLWSCGITDRDAPAAFTHSILVPFCPESNLSGVGLTLEDNQTLWYKRDFLIPESWQGRRVMLHFGAVDWHAKVNVNGVTAGEHTGGYSPFSVDITDIARAGGNSVVVQVSDPTQSGGQPRGKQWNTPGGIWYTRVSGIWQTVWLEGVPRNGVDSLRFTTTLDGGGTGTVACDISLLAADEDLTCAVTIAGNTVNMPAGVTRLRPSIKFAQPRPWSPEDPHLYDVRITLSRGGTVVDEVTSYCAFRTVGVGKDDAGVPRLMLNGKPVFQFGPLDQGYWPDGLYTPPSEAAMKFDIEAAKRMGCNMLRKHVKVESELFYAWCDRLGILVWQDIPSPFFRSKDGERLPELTPRWKDNYAAEAREIVRDFGHHPSIVMWVPWNEGWGQNDLEWSKSMVEMVKEIDPTRLVNNASGWTDMKIGDVNDIHAYPNAATPPVESARAAVLGEFGGLGLPLAGHTLLSEKNWGYRNYAGREELTRAYKDLLRELPPLIAEGLSAAVYTQTTDVEMEVNGWLTYDRKVWKIEPEAVAEEMRALQGPVPRIRRIMPHAGQVNPAERAVWKYTLTAPAAGWEKPGFDRGGWQEGKAGFGRQGTPGAVVQTAWESEEIWLCREFTLESPEENLNLTLYHDEDAEVYINGVPAARVEGYRTNYAIVPIAAAARESLRAGVNTIAIHCRQTKGGQGIDAGLMVVEPVRK